MPTDMRWIDECSGAVFTAVLLACLAGSGCVLDWEESTTLCGNGVLDPGEECDDGASASGDGCSTGCTIDSGWTCSGTPSICTSACGDGVIAVGVEECDEGYTPAVNYDGCSATCQTEAGWVCTGTPSVCTPATGM
jgi:cysteine-rich repeat protein